MIFGPKGKNFSRVGSDLFGSDGDVYHDEGDVVFGPRGRNISRVGSTSFLSHGGTVSRVGETWYGPRGSYSLIGSTLYGPGGRTWSGVSPSEVDVIVDSDF